MNARGIPTAEYQVLHLLSCNSGGTPCWGVPLLEGTPPLVPPVRPGWGYPIPVRGTPPQVPSDLARVPQCGSGWGTPWLDLAGVLPHHLARWDNPPCGQTDRQTRVKTVDLDPDLDFARRVLVLDLL